MASRIRRSIASAVMIWFGAERELGLEQRDYQRAADAYPLRAAAW